ncbi:MAG: adenosylmethionine--8-amino-7-oxononanoate transaminase [Acidothermus sp.]|nr:adenosylmethionine--8-amino-7-oxononanoate transaminase [Acidothermus sp.]MCL6537770.1 adenosylmethionine--8-amino-7-oxononanoate transaminase [Acidothermus sp.]
MRVPSLRTTTPTTVRPSPGSQVAADPLLAFDRAHLWHPYDSATTPGPVWRVESASGVRLRLADGTEVIDGMSSWWCAIHGYRHPVLDAAARDQLARMSHVMFGGLTHESAIMLAADLLELVTDRAGRPAFDHVFFADSGSVAVEVALKMAIQYQAGRGRPRSRILALRGGYHGDTLGAMSVCDPVEGMHRLFAGGLPQQVFAPCPPSGLGADIAEWTAVTSRLVAEHADQLAAIIVEPVLQGAGGMHVYPPACLRVLRELADAFGLLLVFDEIATGFGRTGEFFALHHADVVPDICCVGKALTGGYLTLAAVLCSAEVAAGVSASEAEVLMHGPTFMANPLACAIARANLGLLREGKWREQVAGIQQRLACGLEPCRGLPGVRDVRVLGAVGVVQLTKPVDVPAVTRAVLRRGVWLRPFRDLVYTMPPYICTDDDIDAITAAIRAAVAEVAQVAEVGE